MATFMIFGDLHGRVLPAFALARAWQLDHGETLDGLLQVGDLGYFPDSTRLDKATKRHAQRDLMELGAQLVTRRTPEADRYVRRGAWATGVRRHAGGRALSGRPPRVAGRAAAPPVSGR